MVGDSSQIQPYTVTVTNKDALGCDDVNLSVTGTFPSGVTGSFQDSLLTLAPGVSGATTMNLQLTSTGDATYSMIVKVSDSNLKHQGQAATSLTVDGTAPMAPTGVSASLSGKKRNQSVQLSWNAASDGSLGSGVASYQVYRNGALLGSTMSLSYSDRSFSTTTANDYQLYAVDHVGHVSQTPGSVTYTYSGGSSGPGRGKGNKK
jgi:chitinase